MKFLATSLVLPQFEGIDSLTILFDPFYSFNMIVVYRCSIILKILNNSKNKFGIYVVCKKNTKKVLTKKHGFENVSFCFHMFMCNRSRSPFQLNLSLYFHTLSHSTFCLQLAHLPSVSSF